MSKMSRRKQSKPQHVSNDSDVEEEKLEIDLQPGPSQGTPEEAPALSLAAVSESADALTALAPEGPGPTLSSELIANQALRRTNRRRSATKRSLESQAGLGTSESETEESDGEEAGPSPAKKPTTSPPLPRPMPGRPMTSGQPHRLIRRTCQYCGEVKPTPAALQRHLRKHTGERPFVCTGCHKAYKAKRSLQLHQLTYHPELIDNKKGGLGSRGAPNMIRNAIARRLERQQLSRHQRPEPGEVLPSSSSPFSPPSLASPPIGSPPTFAMAPPPPLNSATTPGDRFGGMSPIDNYYASQVMRHMPDFRTPGGPGQGVPTPTSSFDHTSPSPSPVRPAMESPRAVLPGGGMGHVSLGPGFLYNGLGGDGGEEMGDGESTLDSRTCKVCQKVCAKPSDVKRHMLVHSGVKPFPCVRCGKGFKAKGSMLYHMKAAHNIDVELSQGLEKRYMEQKNRAYRRSLYAKEAPSSKSPEESMLEPDPMSDDASLHYCEEKPASMIERGVVGGSIGRLITEEGPYKQDSISVHNETVLVTRLDGVRVDTEEEVTLYKCYICGRLFNKLSRVQCHLSVHFQLEMTTFQCSVCEETFSEQEDMFYHLEQQHNISRDSAMNGEESLDSAPGTTDASLDRMDQGPQRLEDPGDGIGSAVGPDGNSGSIYTGRIRPYWRRHGGRYSCKICHRTFSNQIILVRHELAHRGQLSLNHVRQRLRPSSDILSRYKDRRGGLRSRFRSLPRIPLQEQDKSGASDMSFGRERGQLQLEEGIKREEISLTSTNQDADDSTDVIEKQQVLEEAKEILEKEGIEEDVTVVVPSDPPSVNQDPHSDTSKSPGSEMASDSQDTEDISKPDTLKPPSKSLLSSFRRENKSRRKSSQPVKLGSKPEDTPKSSPSYAVVSSENSSSYHSTPPEKNSPSESENMLPSRSRADTCLDPSTISSLMGAYSHAAAMQGLHPYFLAAAASQAVAASQAGTSGQAASTQGLLHANGLMPGLAPTSLALGPLLRPSLSVQVSGDGRTLKSPSPSLSPSSQTSPSDPDSLVGYPRVQWGQGPGGEPLAMTSKDIIPSWHPMAMRVSVDGRKVTSLSRTHSRLHVVKQPVDREQACKPTTLPDGRTVYRCNVCNKEFLSYSDINRHMDFHEDIRPYKCKFCEYFARTNSQLKVHMMRHQGIREYCCQLCNYKGVTQSDLNRHMKSQIHMLKSSHQCPDCGEGFVSLTSLESHKCKIRNVGWFKTEAAPTS